MVFSMTGYAAGNQEQAQGSLLFELKSVNGRYLDLNFRISDELRALELPLRELIGSKVSRGKVDCRLYFNTGHAAPPPEALNTALLAALGQLAGCVRAQMPEATPLSVNDVLRWPGMLGDAPMDAGTLAPQALALARTVLDDFAESRAREGQKLATMILDRVAAMRAQVRDVAPRIPEAQALLTEKLRQRMNDALGTANDERILQEIAVFATRIDVAEEITRLGAHLDEVERVIKKGGPCGKRLDFLMQELNREANTLGSKSALTEVSQTAVELKILIEQMREQVQNLE